MAKKTVDNITSRVTHSQTKRRRMNEENSSGNSRNDEMRESAASRALALPEILSMILGNVHLNCVRSFPRDHSIIVCARVSKLWEKATRRFLWRTCSSLSSRLMLRPGPAQLALIETSRRQYYADNINVLWLDVDERSKFLLTGPVLSYPRLVDLTIASSDSSFASVEGHQRLIYQAGPNLRRLRLSGATWRINGIPLQLSDDFFGTVGRLCSRLTKFHVWIHEHPAYNTMSNVSSLALASCLANLKSLKELWLGSNVSSDVFKSVSYLPHLTRLRLTTEFEIKSEWIDTTAREAIFPELQDLCATISNHTLTKLLPHLDRLRSLDLLLGTSSNNDQREHQLRAFAGRQCLCLERLYLEDHRTGTLDGSDLLSFAAAVPHLRDFEAYVEFVAEDLTDGMLEQVVQYLPHLERFHISTEDSPLTEASLLSIGKHCRGLRDCYLPAIVDFGILVRRAQPGFWKNLAHLMINSSRGAMAELNPNMDLLAQDVLAMMPELRAFSSQGHGDFGNHLHKALEERTNGQIFWRYNLSQEFWQD